MMAEPPAQFPVSELDHHSAKVFIGVTVPLLAASLATLTARMIFKIRSQLLFALDDFLILAGAVREESKSIGCAHKLISDRPLLL